MSKGIDIAIDQLTDSLTANLWTDRRTNFMGRIHPTRGMDGESVKLKPLFYVDNRPVDALMDDRYDAQSFVHVMPGRKMVADVVEAECRVLFAVNLDALYPEITSRNEQIETAMEEVRNELTLSQFDITGMTSGYDAYADYGWERDAQSDMQPNHLFRFDLKIVYTNS